jgi:hypothetical protein
VSDIGPGSLFDFLPNIQVSALGGRRDFEGNLRRVAGENEADKGAVNEVEAGDGRFLKRVLPDADDFSALGACCQMLRLSRGVSNVRV